MAPSTYLPLQPGRLHWTRDDLILRDPRGRGVRPSLLRRPASSNSASEQLDVRGPFNVLQRFSIAPEHGASFVETTRDENPIHRVDSVVPGAMMAARLLLLPELLFDDLVCERLRVRFKAIARYDQAMVHHCRFTPVFSAETTDEGRLSRDWPAAISRFEIEFDIRQASRSVASGTASAALDRRAAPPEPTCGATDTARVASPASEVGTFLSSLGISPQAFLASRRENYPRAFLAALPSGEMVRQLAGQGGLLNSLDLRFPLDPCPAAAADDAPSVELESTARQGSAFRKVLTRVVQGVHVRCQGFALVFQGATESLLPSSC